MPSKVIKHAAASAVQARISPAAETVTVAADSGNTERIWVSTDSRVFIYPWYGTPIAPGAAGSVATTSAGQVVYTASGTEPGAVTITTAT